MDYNHQKIDPAPEQSSVRGKEKMAYNSQKIEKKWQRIWEKIGLFQSGSASKKPKFYCLDMFPYPSGEGLHVGHPRGYVATDIFSNYYRRKKYNVLHPMGWDAFGLPAENYAIKTGIQPAISTRKNIKNFKRQIKSLGLGYDWTKEINTTDPEYYKVTQWIFLKFFNKGLAYQSTLPINWCPSCKTGLANEEVVNDRCERCGSEVGRKNLRQWVLKITAYAERLLDDLKDLDWPERIKEMQRNWIGKSQGREIDFKVKDEDLKIEVFTTRADTLFGATYLVLAPEHPMIEKLKEKIQNYKFVKDYIEEAKNKTERERISEVANKTGVELKGITAQNPVNGREIPIFVADYVLAHYGKGAIMAVPAHDQKDWDFAKKYNLPIIEVIEHRAYDNQIQSQAYEGGGALINSERFNGMDSVEAREKIGEWLEKNGQAKKAVHYKLRDWIFSRQRYWGEPIPVVHCPKCGIVPLSEKDLPLKLPKIKQYQPSGTGESPLSVLKNWVNTKCPKCKGPAQRETNTMPQWAGSCWYYIAYLIKKDKEFIWNKKKINYWLPVDLYVGGAEHAVLHLLYARFWHKFLFDLGLVKNKEPFFKLKNQGLIIAPDGQKMSKSKGNVISPDDIVQKYGADTLRLYEMFMGPFDQEVTWSTDGINGCRRFLERILKLKDKVTNQKIKNQELEKNLNKTVKKVTEDIENFRFNTAISALMILLNELAGEKEISKNVYKSFLLLLAPFAPHLAEQLWQEIKDNQPGLAEFKAKDSIHRQSWPKYDQKLIKEEFSTLIIQINGKVREKVKVKSDISEKEAKGLAISNKNLQKWIEGKEIKKIIFVPGKLINIVI